MGGRHKRDLSPQQEKFLLRYLETGNATQSYAYAYPKSTLKSAGRQAVHLLKHPKVIARLKERTESVNAEIDDILREIALLAFKDFDVMCQVQGGLACKTKNLELLGKYHKMFTERLEVEVRQGLAADLQRAKDRLNDDDD